MVMNDCMVAEGHVNVSSRDELSPDGAEEKGLRRGGEGILVIFPRILALLALVR